MRYINALSKTTGRKVCVADIDGKYIEYYLEQEIIPAGVCHDPTDLVLFNESQIPPREWLSDTPSPISWELKRIEIAKVLTRKALSAPEKCWEIANEIVNMMKEGSI